MITLSKVQRKLIREGMSTDFSKKLLYSCPICNKAVLMVWREGEHSPVRVAYRDCITFQSHINRIPKTQAAWEYYAFKLGERK
jgi:hypothetical protein